MSFLNPVAELDSPDSGNLVPPQVAYPIKDSNKFYCPDHDCKDPNRSLTIKISINNNAFFSHKPNCEHDISPETLLHKLAIKWFEGKTEFEVPELCWSEYKSPPSILKIDSSRTVCEFRRLKRIIPDVKLVSASGFEFAIEIYVTNDVSENKSKLIEQFNLPTLRVDLSNFYNVNKQKCRIDHAFVQSHLTQLLTTQKLKSWVIVPDQEQIQGDITIEQIPVEKPPIKQKSNDDGCLTVLFGIGIVLFIKELFTRK